jgi:hypothetical protein
VVTEPVAARRRNQEVLVMWSKLRFYAVSVVILGLSAAVVWLRYYPPEPVTVRTLLDPPAIVQQVQQLRELVSVKYTVQKIIGLEEQKVPFGSETLAMSVQARVLAGVDLAELRPEDVHVSPDNTVSIRLPTPRLLHVYVDESQTRVAQRTRTWWTPWEPYSKQLDQKARLAALEAVQATALQMGILRDARQNAETAIREFLAALGIESVRFEDGPTGAWAAAAH